MGTGKINMPEETIDLSEDDIKTLVSLRETWREKDRRIHILNRKRLTFLFLFSLLEVIALLIQVLKYSTFEITIGIIIVFLVVFTSYNLYISHKVNDIIFDRGTNQGGQE